jgi:hypothetical protein
VAEQQQQQMGPLLLPRWQRQLLLLLHLAQCWMSFQGPPPQLELLLLLLLHLLWQNFPRQKQLYQQQQQQGQQQQQEWRCLPALLHRLLLLLPCQLSVLLTSRLPM